MCLYNSNNDHYYTTKENFKMVDLEPLKTSFSNLII